MTLQKLCYKPLIRSSELTQSTSLIWLSGIYSTNQIKAELSIFYPINKKSYLDLPRYYNTFTFICLVASYYLDFKIKRPPS